MLWVLLMECCLGRVHSWICVEVGSSAWGMMMMMMKNIFCVVVVVDILWRSSTLCSVGRILGKWSDWRSVWNFICLLAKPVNYAIVLCVGHLGAIDRCGQKKDFFCWVCTAMSVCGTSTYGNANRLLARLVLQTYLLQRHNIESNGSCENRTHASCCDWR